MMIFKKDQRKLMGTDQMQKGNLTVCSWAFSTERTTTAFRLKSVSFPFSSSSHLFSTFFITVTGNRHVAATSCGKWPVVLPMRSRFPILMVEAQTQSSHSQKAQSVWKHQLPTWQFWGFCCCEDLVVCFLVFFLKTKGLTAVRWAAVVLTTGGEPHCVYGSHLHMSFSRASYFPGPSHPPLTITACPHARRNCHNKHNFLLGWYRFAFVSLMGSIAFFPPYLSGRDAEL